MSFSYYNIFVGTENGLFKGINSKAKTFNNLNNIENLSKDKEIFSMCWSNDQKQDQVLFATRDQHIVKYNSYHDVEAPFTELGHFDFGNGLLKGFELIDEDKIVTCVDKGILKLFSFKEKSEFEFDKEILLESKIGSDINCIKKNKFNFSQLACGGRENDLKVWDLNKLESFKPIFQAKNVADNWIQLREPVWVMCLDYIDENRIAVGTGHHQVRIYDMKSNMRRPIFNLKFSEHPITVMSVLPDQSNRLIAGNTRGEMEMIDLRAVNTKNEECRSVKKYKGFQGTIKSAQIVNTPSFELNGSNMCIATCGLDRFLRVHHVETSQLISKVYLKSRLNCLLFSKHEPIKVGSVKQNKDEDELSIVNSEDLGTDDLWSDMEQIIDEHPNLNLKKSKRKLEKRLEDFNESEDQTDLLDQDGFKKPKVLTKKNKKIK